MHTWQPLPHAQILLTGCCLVAFTISATAAPQSAAGPGARYASAMAYDSARQVVVLFGGNRTGQHPSGNLGDTWEWDGSTWTQRTPTQSPPARHHAGMAFDATRNVCVLFGGYPAQADVWEWDGINWKSRTFAVSPPGRYAPAMAYDPVRQRTVVFGGNASPNDLGDTWIYDGGQWVQSLAAAPSPRTAAAMAFSASTARIVLFGGLHSTPFAALAETWEWDGANWTMRQPMTNPPARWACGMCPMPTSGHVAMFGGWRTGPIGDTWLWDGSTWTQMPIGRSPAPRDWVQNNLVFDASRSVAVMHGGWSGTAAYDDTWRFDGTSWEPILHYVRSPVNGRLYAQTPPMTWVEAEALAVQEGGHLVTIRNAQEQSWILQTFGATLNWIGLNDIAVEGSWVWSSGEPTTYSNWCPGEPNNLNNEDYGHISNCGGGRWNDAMSTNWPGIVELPAGPVASLSATPIATISPPIPLSDHAMAALPNGGMLLFGGTHGSSPQPHTYRLDGSTFSIVYPNVTPAPRVGHTLLLDPVRANNVLFGGENPLGALLGGTWIWSNNQWNLAPTATEPSPRTGHRMSFDAVAVHVLLFGGRDAGGQHLADLWRWDGSSWSALPATGASPQARRNHGLAFDTLRSKTVLFGGTDGTSHFDDVWEWSGTSWTFVPVAAQHGFKHAPQAREQFAMAYDPRSGSTVVAGGADAQGCYADVWSWDGAQWTIHLPTAASFSPRSGASLVLDTGDNEFRLFAGSCGSVFTNDLWSVVLPVASRWSRYGVGCAGTLGIPDLAVRAGSTAIIGHTLVCDVTNAPTSAFNFAFGTYDLQRDTFLNQPIPVDLASFGLGGCSVWSGASWSVLLPTMQPGVGTNLQVPLPNWSGLLGMTLYLQAIVFDNANGRWAAVTNGVEARIGNY